MRLPMAVLGVEGKNILPNGSFETRTYLSIIKTSMVKSLRNYARRKM